MTKITFFGGCSETGAVLKYGEYYVTKDNKTYIIYTNRASESK